MNRSALMLFTVLTALATNVQAQTPRDLRDLVGMRASSGERELEDLGYRFVNSSKDRDRIGANWWNRSQRKCVTVVTMNGRYDAITDTLPADCDRR